MLTLLLVIVPAAFAAKITTTEQLIEAMQKKYAKSWYQTVTFVQKTTNIDKDGNQKVGIWYEALSVPGLLQIDITPIKDGNGILFTNGQLYSFKNGKVDNSRAFVHPLLILGFDIYRLPQAEVIEKLKGLKFDLSILREDTWQGRPVYVVGAKQGDLQSPQFWIDQKNLYFVCMLRPSGRDGAQTQETQIQQVSEIEWRVDFARSDLPGGRQGRHHRRVFRDESQHAARSQTLRPAIFCDRTLARIVHVTPRQG
jgi:hypothetical protein